MEFNSSHIEIRKVAREFAERELTPEILDETERSGMFPLSIYRKMGALGLLGIKTPKKYGGLGADYLSYVIVMEEIARVSMVATVFLTTPNSLGGGPLLLSGTEEQLDKYLRPAVTGEKFISFAITEPGAGSDAGGTVTTAEKDGDYFILNGRKTFITGAPIAGAAIIYTRTDRGSKGGRGITAFIVDLDLPGVSTGKPEDKMGIIGCPTSDIILENVRVHKSAMLGEEGMGFKNAMKTLDIGRIGIAAQSIGVAQGCLDEAIKFAKNHQCEDGVLADQQAIRFSIAEMAAKLKAAKELTYEAARLKEIGDPDAGMTASMAKLIASETCNELAAKSLQVHGEYGYMKGSRIERLYRDSRVLTIYEGTSQIQKVVISGQLLR